MQDSAIAKIAESVLGSPNTKELEAVMLNAAQTLPSRVYDQMIGSILQGYLVAKKMGVNVPIGDPHALAGMAQIGAKTKDENNPIDFITSLMLQQIGQEYDMTVKPKWDMLKKTQDEVMKAQMEVYKDQLRYVQAIGVQSLRNKGLLDATKQRGVDKAAGTANISSILEGNSSPTPAQQPPEDDKGY
jgi:hypothetical protein